MQVKPFLLSVLAILILSGARCKKKKCGDGPFTTGYIIGYDPCTAKSNDKKGYVIKFENTSDTIVAYFLLPSSISIPPALFDNYQWSYLFPQQYSTSFQIKVRYHSANPSEFVTTMCRPDILVADFLNATKGKQHVIDCLE
jgi:hypothetical protein